MSRELEQRIGGLKFYRWRGDAPGAVEHFADAIIDANPEIYNHNNTLVTIDGHDAVVVLDLIGLRRAIGDVIATKRMSRRKDGMGRVTWVAVTELFQFPVNADVRQQPNEAVLQQLKELLLPRAIRLEE